MMIKINSGLYKRQLENRKIYCKTSNDAIVSDHSNLGTDTPHLIEGFHSKKLYITWL